MIKTAILWHLLFTSLYLGTSLALAGPRYLASIGIGCLFMGGNLALLMWAWGRIFQKKSIALAGSVIVFKYAILGMIIYIVTSRPELDDFGFLVGLTSIVPTIGVFGLQFAKQK